MTYKFLEHTADLKVLIKEKSLERAFLISAMALKEAIVEKIEVKNIINKNIEISGKDKEALLYNFLEEFLYLLDAESFLIGKIKKIKITKEKEKYRLTAIVSGDKAQKYRFNNDVKAITYNEMFVKDNKGKVEIQFVLDV